MRKYVFFMLSCLAIYALASLATVVAQPVGGNVTNATGERTQGTSAGNITVEGGNVTEVNLTSNQVTSNWAGFWGSITGGLIIGDASGNNFYTWTVSNVSSAVVYAVNTSTAPTWASMERANSSLMPATINGTGTDSYNNTFTQTGTFASPSLSTIPNVNYTQTLNNTGNANLRTWALVQGGSSIWAGLAENNANGFNGQTVDYQILAPTAAAGTTYYFYVDLP